MNMLVPVVETFVSLQGEGPSAGEPALFIRLANCNLNCVWCDTRHSWDWATFDEAEEVESMTPDELSERLARQLPRQVNLLVLTGGEPLLHQASVFLVLDKLRESRPGLRVEVETNGTIAPTEQLRELVHLFVVSPKLANSAIPEKRRLRVPVLAEFSRLRSVLKFVVEGPHEVQEAAELAARSGYPSSRVWVMPQTTSAADLGQLIAELSPAAIRAGFKISSRLQVLAWGDARGT
jgi:organic radical activating enzyme